MRQLYLLLLLLSASFSAALAQKGRFDVRFLTKSIDCAANNAVIQLQVRANRADSTFLMGDANFRFDYNPQAINNPAILTQVNLSNASPASDANYAAQSLNGSTAGTTKGTVSLNVFYSGGNNGAKPVGTDWLTVSEITFRIVDASKCFDLQWHTNETFPVTGMNEVTVTSTNPFTIKKTSVKASGVFDNVSVCVPQYCSAVNAVNDNQVTQVNTPISGSVLTNDTGGPLSVTAINAPAHGQLLLNSDGTYTYTPNTGYTGRDSVQYRTCKQLNPGVCATAYLSFTIQGPQNPVVTFGDCANATRVGLFTPNGTGGQTGQLILPVTVTQGGSVSLTVTGTGFSSTPNPFVATVTPGTQYLYVPIVYDGSGTNGIRTLTITSPQLAGTCSTPVKVGTVSNDCNCK